MWIAILSVVITALGFYLEFRRSVVKSESTLLKLSKYILVLGILGLIGNGISQEIDNNRLSSSLYTLNNDNKLLRENVDSISGKLALIQHNYDSLQLQNIIIATKLESTKKQLQSIENKTDKGFKSNEDYFKSIDKKNLERQRILSTNQQEILISELRKCKSSIIISWPAIGDQEIGRYVEYFIDVFKKSGWEVEPRAVIKSTDNRMIDINIIIKSLEYEPLVDVYRCLNMSFKKAGLNFKFRIDKNAHSFDDIDLYITRE